MDLSNLFDGEKNYSEEVGDFDGFNSIPSGWYEVTVEKAELKSPNDSMKVVEFQLRIGGPTHENRVVFPSAIIVHNNETAANIGRAFFQSLMTATGSPGSMDLDDAIGATFELRIDQKKVTEKVEDKVRTSESNGKRYLFGTEVDDNNTYNVFPRCRPLEGSETKSSDSNLPDFLTK